MLGPSHKFLLLVGVLAIAAGRAVPSQDHWNCHLAAYWGALGGAPHDRYSFLGVYPGATDGFDVGVESKKPGEPFGLYVYSWFARPAWGHGPIGADWRGPIDEGTSRRWGTAVVDTWNVKTNLDNGPSGVLDECFGDREFPIAASIYITWRFGVGETPPPTPPDDYIFTLIYRGGVNPKPAGTKLPDAMDPPAIGTAWNMEATRYLLLPLWSVDFQPYLADCSGLAAPDTPRFWILVTNPDTIPTCTILMDPDGPQRPPATFTFTAAAAGDEPFTFSWDFGDGATETGSAVTHTYDALATYAVTCTVTDANGDAGTCTLEVEVTSTPNQRPICDISYDPARSLVDEAITFSSNASDPDGTVASVDWDFGDGGTASGEAATHAYAGRGVYTVVCTVTDDQGKVGTCHTTVTTGVAIYVDCNSDCPSPDGSWECPYRLIQDAIDAASDGDIVIVRPCIYYENINFLGKAIAVTSTDPLDPATVAATVIDGGVSYPVATFGLGEGDDSVLTGFTITNGSYGIYCWSSSPTIIANTISANAWGGIYCSDCSPAITNNAITANSAGDGGGIFCSYSSPSIVANTISGNSATGMGGGIYASGRGSSLTIADNVISGNTAHSGGGVWCDHSPATIANNIISGNSAGDGGGIYCDFVSSATIRSNLITGNSTRWDGAGIYCWYSSPIIVANTISGNSAGWAGGAIYCFHSSTEITNSVVSGNSAEYGGGIYCSRSSPTITHCTIADNSASNGDGVYSCKDSSPWVTNSIVWDHVLADDTSFVDITYSDTLDPSPGAGNISAPPQFVDPASGDYHLLPSSPCIDAGTNVGAPPDDIDGDPRPWPPGGLVDMGADESLNHAPICDIAHEPGRPTTDDVIVFTSGAADPYGAVASVAWDFGDGSTASGDPAVHAYAQSDTYAVCVTVTDDQGWPTTCCGQVRVTLPCLCDVEIDRGHCKLLGAGRRGRCKTGEIGARNRSATRSCDVVMRVRDEAGNVIFQTVRTLAPHRKARARFRHCFTPNQMGRNRWTWEVWPIDCAERTPWNNVFPREVILRR